MDYHIFIPIIFLIFLFPGVILSAFPLMPAVSYMFILSFIFGAVDKFNRLTLNELGFLGGIFALSVMIDYGAGVLGAKWAGAGMRSIIMGIVGSTIGILIFFPFGSFFGLFAGVLIGELTSKGDTKKAVKTATASLLGAIVGVILNALLAIGFFTLTAIFILT